MRRGWGFLSGVMGGVLASLLVCGGAQGVPVVYQFSGFIEEVYEPYNEFGGAVHVGDPFTVTYTFDSEAPDSVPDDPNRSHYEGLGAGLILPGFTYSSPSVSMGINSVRLGQLGFGTPFGAPRFVTSFSSLPLDSDALPAPWSRPGGRLAFVAYNSPGKLFGRTVPEPGMAVMLLLGALAGLGRRGGLAC